jgi:hypothetical protein
MLLPLFSYQLNQLATGYLNSTMFHSKSPLTLCNVVMRMAGVILKPPTLYADCVSHSVQLLKRIGNHVAHLHTPVGIGSTVNVYTHSSLRPPDIVTSHTPTANAATRAICSQSGIIA